MIRNQYSRVIQDSVFLCRKMGSIIGYFGRYIIIVNIKWDWPAYQ